MIKDCVLNGQNLAVVDHFDQHGHDESFVKVLDYVKAERGE